MESDVGKTEDTNNDILKDAPVSESSKLETTAETIPEEDLEAPKDDAGHLSDEGAKDTAVTAEENDEEGAAKDTGAVEENDDEEGAIDTGAVEESSNEPEYVSDPFQMQDHSENTIEEAASRSMDTEVDSHTTIPVRNGGGRGDEAFSSVSPGFLAAGGSAPPPQLEEPRETPKPPPTEQTRAQQQQQPKKSTPKTKPVINPDFEDLQQTGKWGKISKWECVIGVTVVIIAIVVAIVVAVVVTNNKKDQKNSAPTKPPVAPPATPAPSLAPQVSPQVQLSEVLRLIGNNTLTNASLSILPNTVAFYKDKANDVTQPNAIRALSWLLYDDTRKQLEGIQFRYSLAALYYAWGGAQWINGTNWLTGLIACQWAGVRCDLVTGELNELDLRSNNLVGTIPNELALLTDLRALDLSYNHLSGTLPGNVVGSLPVLSIINIASNSFTGPFPDNLRQNGVLQSLFIQFNNFTGCFPLSYCNLKHNGPPVLNQFTLDCQKMSCCLARCCSGDNCY